MRRYCFKLAMLSLAAFVSSAVRGDDQQIAQEIVQKLQAEKQAGTLKGFSIDLNVDDGTVWLSGRVANDQQLARALDLARRATGVQQVVNDLTVTNSTPVAVAAQPAPPRPAARTQQEPRPAEQPTVAKATGKKAAKPVAQEQPQPSLMQTVTAQPMPVQPEPTPARNPVQAVSVSQEFAAAANAGPVGSGVDATAAAAHRLAAPPVPAVPAQPGYPAAQAAGMPMQQPYAVAVPVYAGSRMQVPLAMGPAQTVNYAQHGVPAAPEGAMGPPAPMYMPGSGVGIAPARYDHPSMPGYAWPSYASYPNYAGVTYPKQYSPTAWPYIGPFYPYPQVPLGWRKVTMEWDDGWWMLDFKDRRFGGRHF